MHIHAKGGAHLRAGGAALRVQRRNAATSGASPRGRSSRVLGPGVRWTLGRISARAEQPRSARRCRSSPTAHLRAGGAAGVSHATDVLMMGASPRGRSSRRRAQRDLGRGGRISARAEQPRRRRSSARRSRAHLRAGGAATALSRTSRCSSGASPRGRSSPGQLAGRCPLQGRISARAEQPAPPSPRLARAGAHLRAGGAASTMASLCSSTTGASPRGRSSRAQHRGPRVVRRRISARAEQPAEQRAEDESAGAHLRAGGAAANGIIRVQVWRGASPRGRSSPRGARRWRRGCAAHLRAGGAASSVTCSALSETGASPRGRSSQGR